MNETIGGIIVVSVAVIIAIISIYCYDKCPRCWVQLTFHKDHPNARVCPKCGYLKVNY